MNIICNNCVGGRLYQQLNISYNNPFIWSRIYYPSFKKLILDFNKINFYKYSFRDKNGVSQIVIENRIELNFTHYKYDKDYDEPTQIEHTLDIRCKDIRKYTIDKYSARLKRMNRKDKNVFVLVDHENLKLKDDEIKDFLNLKTPFYKICVTGRKHIKSKNVPILYTNEYNTSKIAELMLKNNMIKL